MFGTAACILICSLGSSAAHTRTSMIPLHNPCGYLYQPSRDLDKPLLLPAREYQPQPGDVLIMSNTNLAWTVLYKMAFTGKPGHAAIVVRLPCGRIGILEAGISDTLWTHCAPVEERLNNYGGSIWIRRRKVPLTECESRRLTDFANQARGCRYDILGLSRQITPFRTRGPLRTYFVGKPRGPGHKYFCAEAVLEALVYAGLLDEETTRPSATYPRDMFFDDSPNLYIRKHPPLACGWEVPALWTPCVGSTASGKERWGEP